MRSCPVTDTPPSDLEYELTRQFNTRQPSIDKPNNRPRIAYSGIKRNETEKLTVAGRQNLTFLLTMYVPVPMNIFTIQVIRHLSWSSLAAPFIAFALCYLESLGVTDFLWPEDMFAATRIDLVWRYSFFASAILGLLALIGSLVFRDKPCILRSVGGIILSALVAKISVLMTMIC